MSKQIIISELFVTLSDEQQELLAGSADFEMNNTNYAETLKAFLESNISSPQGNNIFATGLDRVINTAAQNFSGFGGAIPSNWTALSPPPVF
ncbi:hypothetical protein NIES4074_42750 [Cylindrospermum sp. NIES-4074]|nr:hypothetical protein NIES4074_42750 [Cylindrospermum sp. NIES-4074]